MSFPAGGSPSGFSVRSLPAEPVAKPGTKRKWPGWAVFFGKLSKPGGRPMNGPRLLTRFQKARRPGRGAGVWARRFCRLWGAARRSRRFSKNHVTQRAGRQKPAAWKARATPGRSSGGFPKSRALRAPRTRPRLAFGGRFWRASSGGALWGSHFWRGSIVWCFRLGEAAIPFRSCACGGPPAGTNQSPNTLANAIRAGRATSGRAAFGQNLSVLSSSSKKPHKI